MLKYLIGTTVCVANGYILSLLVLSIMPISVLETFTGNDAYRIFIAACVASIPYARLSVIKLHK